MPGKIPLRGDRIRELREKRGWSQRELARRCGFAAGQVGKYENEEIDPSSTYLTTLANVFGVSVDYLLGRSDDPHGKTIILDLTDDEREIMATFRRDGWTGVGHLALDRAAGKG